MIKMQDKKEINESYLTWRNGYVKALEEDGAGRHGYQNCFYGKLLIETFEKLYAEYLHTLKVNEQFEKIIRQYSFNLRAAYGYEWDKAKAEAANHAVFIGFIAKLEQNQFLSKPEIKKFAPLLAQNNRTAGDQSFFGGLPQDFLHELAGYLEPQLSFHDAAKKLDDEVQKAHAHYDKIRMFSFKDNEIHFSSIDGTHVALTGYEPFNEWFTKLPLRTNQAMSQNYQMYKIDDNTISINRGPQTPGIQIKRRDAGFIVCNNVTADKNSPHLTPQEANLEKSKNLISSLKALKKYLQSRPAELKFFSFEKEKVAFAQGTHVSLTVEDAFKAWFDDLPLRKSQQISSICHIYKINADTVAINYGPNTPGIRIIRKDNSFSACNNITADNANSDATKQKNLVTTLSALEKALQAIASQAQLAEQEKNTGEEQEKCSIQ